MRVLFSFLSSSSLPRRAQARFLHIISASVGLFLPSIRGFSFLLLCVLTTLHASAARVIDDFSYDSPSAARQAWQARNDSPNVVPVPPPVTGLTFPVPFRKPIDRVYWDRAVSADLSRYDVITLDLTCDHPRAMRSLAVYFKSGDGWYVWNRSLPRTGRQSIRMLKSDFQTEGRPAGWHRIEAIRISPWKGEARDTQLILHSLTAHATSIFIMQGTTSAPDDAERTASRRATQRISRWLTDMNISHGVITDEQLTADIVQRARLIILPYNPNLSPDQRRHLRSFLRHNGKLMVFYSADAELASMMGLRLGEYMQTRDRARWVSFSFDEPAPWRVPPRVYQESWNIRPAHPAAKDSRVIAWWENMEGKRDAEPAWTASPHGLWMSHILLQSDNENKRTMLAGLVGRYVPDVWRDVARAELERVGTIDSFTSFDQAVTSLSRLAARSPEKMQIRRLLDKAREQHRRMIILYEAERYPEVVSMSRSAMHALTEAYARAQQPKTPERRGVWDHGGTGLYPGDWDRTAKLLAEHGFNTIFPNMLWGGVAHYESRVLPRSETFRLYGDQIELCVRAAQKHGLDVHVWAVCWNLTGAPPVFVERMRREGRLQVDAGGRTIPWLNPAHPDNRRLLIDSLMEIADRYPIQGLHLDYIRYPHANACYSDYSRKAFAEWLGRPAAGWPGSVQPGGNLAEPYRRFRVDQINLTVRGIKRQIGEKHPDLEISAAVFGGYPEIVDSIGQDWAAWLKRGDVDFIVPMNYTTDPNRFGTLTRTQMNLPGARGNIMPGLGVTASESQLTADQVIEQIVIARELGAPGYLLFDLNITLAREILPMLRLGLTRDE